MATIQQVIHDIETFARTVEANREDIPYEFKTSIVREIVRTASIDTTRFIQAVNYHPLVISADAAEYSIDASDNPDVIYDDILERGRKDGANYPGRFIYQHGIENADIESITDNWANSSFIP